MKKTFTGNTRLFLCISGAIIAIALVMQIAGVGMNMGIDFTGGSILSYSVGENYDVNDVITILQSAGYNDQPTKAAPSAAPIALQAELAAQAAEGEAAQKAAAAAAKKNKNKKPVVTVEPQFRTYARQLLEALDWLTDQNGNEESEYYHLIDLEKVAAMGQSCGGAQVLGVAHDPRIKTCMIFNSGIGEMSMSGASKKSLANLHTPMLYINGGTADVAYNNANGDWGRIADCIPVVKISTLDGHHGTYYEKNAGAFAVVARMWLNWQLKGIIGDSALFMNDEYEKTFYPEWTFERQNW
jgi:hypothetical protein